MRCATCGTSVGPFARDRDFPGLPVCGYRPRHHATIELRDRRVKDCLARRDALDAQRYR